MVVKFLNPNDNQRNNPSFRYRTDYVIKGLQNRGWDADAFTDISERCDVGIIHCFCSLRTALKVRKNSHYLIYDINDNLYFLENDHKNSRFIAYISDMVVSASQYLIRRYLPLNKNCFWIPDLIDYDFIFNKDSKKIKDKRNQVIITWMGYIHNVPYLEEVSTALISLSKEYDFILKVITSEWSDVGFSNRNKVKELMPSVKTRFVKWSYDTFLSELIDSDIAIAPLFDNEFCKSKSENKLISYMVVGLPVIASPIPAYKNIIKDGYNGFLAESPGEWEKKLKALIVNEGLRSFIGVNGKKLTQYFSEKNIISMWEAVLNTIKQNTV